MLGTVLEPILLSVWLLAPCLQDVPKISWEKTAPFSEFISELDVVSGRRIRRNGTIEQKELKLSVREAGFFEALDALCRAHGGVTYLPGVKSTVEGSGPYFWLAPNPWEEWPSTYSGHFKVAIRSMTAVHTLSSRGDLQATCVSILLFAPPFCRINHSLDADARVTIEEAIGPDGTSVLPSKEIADLGEFVWINEIGAGRNVKYQTLFLNSFDVDRGLKLLRGSATVKTSEAVELEVPIEVGKRVELAEGAFTVDAIHEWRYPGHPQRWATFTYHPNEAGTGSKALDTLLEPMVCIDGQWTYPDLRRKEFSFSVPFWQKPKQVTFFLRRGVRTVVVPFVFRDLRFKKE